MMQQIRIKAQVFWSVKVMWRIHTASFFLTWAWLALRGKALIVDSREVRAKGGFKYLQCELTYTPVDKDHRYST